MPLLRHIVAVRRAQVVEEALLLLGLAVVDIHLQQLC